MATNSFTARVFWGPRADTPAQLGARVLRAADALSTLHPLLRSWWLLDQYFEQDFVPLDRIRSNIAALVESGVVRDDFDEPEPSSGYWCTLVNNVEQTPKTIKVTTQGGVARAPYPSLNSASFETAYDQVPDPELLTFGLLKASMMTLAQVHQATAARVYCSALLDDPRSKTRFFRPAWMAYLAAPLATRVIPPADVPCERTPDGGLLMIATEETFDPDNPAHVAAAWALSDALLPITGQDF